MTPVRASTWRRVSTDPVFIGCTSKRAYPSRREAEEAAARLAADKGKLARAYRCDADPKARRFHFHVASHKAGSGRAA